MSKNTTEASLPEMGLESLFGVKGKIALVTGGGVGLGKMMAAALVRNGAKVYIASRKLPALQKTANELSALSPPNSGISGPACIPLTAELSTKAGCDDLAAKIKEKETNLDILINNSGVAWGAPLDNFPEEKGWDKTFHLNVKSQFYLTVALLPLLEVGKSNTNQASVIMVSSIAGFMPIAGGALGLPGTGTFSYQPSKAASIHLARTLANQLADKFILVNAICPGTFPSGMTAHGLKNNSELIHEGQPTGRIGQPEDIGGLAVFLSSRAASHISGAAIPIDGGQSIQWMPRL